MERINDQPVPKVVRRRRKDPYGPRLQDLAPWQLEEILESMCQIYSAHEQEMIEVCDEREREDLRIRADGTPSARRPAAVLPVAYWATVQDAPDGGDYDTTNNRLRAYQQQLEFWAAKGVYRGPTALTYVNREEDPDATA